MANSDTQVKAILKQLAEQHDNDVTEVSVVTGISQGMVRQLLNGTAAGTSKMLARLRRALTGKPAPKPRSYIRKDHPHLEQL